MAGWQGRREASRTGGPLFDPMRRSVVATPHNPLPPGVCRGKHGSRSGAPNLAAREAERKPTESYGRRSTFLLGLTPGTPNDRFAAEKTARLELRALARK